MNHLARAITVLLSPLLLATGGHAQVPTWTDVTPLSAIPDNNTAAITDVAFGNGIFVATLSTSMVTGKVSVFTSTDGTTWTRREVGDGGLGGVAVVNIAFTGDRFIFATGERVYTSTDGIVWNSVTHPGLYPHYVAHGGGTSVLVANNLKGMFSSTDFTTWTPRTNPSAASFSFVGVSHGPGGFFAFGNAGGPVFNSPDGVTWTERSDLAVAGGSRLRYGNGVWLSTNQNNFRVSYDNGATFVSYVNNPAFINSEMPSFTDGRFITRSIGTSMKTSVDGSTWSAFGTLPNNNYANAVAAGNGKYVAVGWYFGTSSKAARFAVADLPTGVATFEIQPTPTVVYTGQSLRLGASVIGSGLGYQWLRNNAAIPGATNPVYYVNTASLSDAGNYALRVTNSNGPVTSETARVTVYAPGGIYDGIVGYYPFEDGTGTDRSGHGRNLTAFGPIATTTGSVGGAAHLQPVTGSPATVAGFSRTPTTGFDNTAMTLALWVRPDAAGLGNPPLAGLRSTAGVHFYALLLDGLTASRAAAGNAGGNTTLQKTTGLLANNAWTHLAVTVSGTSMKLYVNGALDRTVTTAAIPVNPGLLDRFFVGGINIGTVSAFAGALDELWVFNRALSDAEIAQLRADNGSLIPISGAPQVTTQPLPQTINASGALTLSVATNDGTATVQWYHNGNVIPGATALTYAIANAQRWNAGTYYARFTNSEGSANSSTVSVAINPPPANAGRLMNLSTRAQALTGDDVLIPGFVVTGTGNKRVLIRSVGPTLGKAPFNIGGVLPDPRMRLMRRNPSTQLFEEIATNDNWGTNGNAAAITQTMVDLAAFPFNDSLESALLMDLAPGAYTVIADGVGDTSGIAIVELYDADTGTPGARLANIANRGFAGTGDQVMIAGFVVSSEGPKTLLIRVVGPTLGSFGVPNTMADPKLTVFSGPTALFSNDNWGDNPDAATTTQVAQQVGAFPLPNSSKDAAFVVTLQPGAYTVVSSSATPGATGVVIVEVYVVP